MFCHNVSVEISIIPTKPSIHFGSDIKLIENARCTLEILVISRHPRVKFSPIDRGHTIVAILQKEENKLLDNLLVMISPHTQSFHAAHIGYTRCGYTGHFYRGKLSFYHGKLYLVV